MLQQTPVERVRPYYERWLSRWPTAAGLARAPVADAIREWGGLGYNRRAVNLHRACVAAVATKRGALPVRVDDLAKLPGIGPYTAAAVASFALAVPVAVVDTNVGRVLARATLGAASAKVVPARQLREAAARVLPARNVRDHNLALMDLGATVCMARAPNCAACPLARACKWLTSGAPAPPVAARPAEPFERTARFARGHIIELLRRSGPLGVDEISGALPPNHQGRTETYLAGLERDGLLDQQRGLWGLPGVTAG